MIKAMFLTTVSPSSFIFYLLILHSKKLHTRSIDSTQDDQITVLANFSLLVPMNNLPIVTPIAV